MYEIKKIIKGNNIEINKLKLDLLENVTEISEIIIKIIPREKI